MEIWVDINGFEELYQVSDAGRVKSLARTVSHRGFNSKRQEKILAIRRDGKGYHQYRLYKDGVSHYPKVHRLVGEHFLLNVNNLPQINHKDRDKENNSVRNLEWCTAQQNTEHSNAKHYLLLSPTGEKVEVYNLRSFCKQHNLVVGNLHKTISKERKHNKGWVLLQKL